MKLSIFLVATLVSSSAGTAEDETKPKQDSQQAIVVVGASGSPQYAKQFQSWADQWKSACTAGNVAVQIFAERSEPPLPANSSEDSEIQKETTVAPDPVDRSAPPELPENRPAEQTLQQLVEAIRTASQTPSLEPLWIVLLGHGTYDGRSARFNLPGPDISAAQLAEACQNAQRPLIIINCSSCSAPFINALSGPERIVVTATKSGSESQYSRFGQHFANAIGSLEADLNQDGQTSVREAWLVAAASTQAFYESEGRLATEHSLLDDNGDQAGSASSSFENGRVKENLKQPEKVDGKLAGRSHLIRSPEEQRLTADQRKQRDDLETRLESLRSQKNNLSEQEYLNQLEKLLIPLAKLYADAAD